MGVHKGVSIGCNHCQDKATQQGNLKKIILPVHDGVKDGCGECDLTFVYCKNHKNTYAISSCNSVLISLIEI